MLCHVISCYIMLWYVAYGMVLVCYNNYNFCQYQAI